MTPAEHLARAEAELTAGDYEAACAHALFAIAGTPIQPTPRSRDLMTEARHRRRLHRSAWGRR